MEEAAKLAKEGNYDYFTTTLSISPLKNAEKINEIGEALAEIYEVRHLPSDFKRKTVINVLLSCHTNMAFIGRIIADVFFQSVSRRKNETKQISEGSAL